MIKVEISCKEHPKYQAKSRPSSQCPDCWYLWSLVHDKTWAYKSKRIE